MVFLIPFEGERFIVRCQRKRFPVKCPGSLFAFIFVHRFKGVVLIDENGLFGNCEIAQGIKELPVTDQEIVLCGFSPGTGKAKRHHKNHDERD